MRGSIARLQFVLDFLALLFCLLIHLATFFLTIPLYWIVVPFAFVMISGILRRITRVPAAPGFTFGGAGTVGVGLFVYAIAMFVYVYRSTDGATSVAVQNGHYISLYKDRVLKSITHDEYVIFPNLWVRALSAWVGAMAWFGVTD